MHRLRGRLTYANVMSTLAVFVALGGTAMAAVIITSNTQVAQGTISGHKPPSGSHSNIISGSVNATDLANQSVTAAKLKSPEAWHNVGAGSTAQDLCTDPSQTAVFCSPNVSPPNYLPWRNYGAPFATAGFYKDQLGVVHLKGLVDSRASNVGSMPTAEPIFRLPAAYAPGSHRVFPTVGRGLEELDVVQGRIDVRPDGLVVLARDCGLLSGNSDCSASGEGYVTLEAISFRPDG